jgi:UDP-2,3-diacylglucosamine pyrophosphatase LpxH
MKSVIIGDIHGRTSWEQIVEKENNANRFIFVGDYFDTHESIRIIVQLHNFKRLIEFKNNSKADVIMLIGNHDFHYMPFANETYSGHQRGHHHTIQSLLMEHINELSMCYKMDKYLFSHAGVSYKWLEYWLDKSKTKIRFEDIDVLVNDLFIGSPRAFKFSGWDPYGDSVESSPIWIRPKSLQESNYDTLRKEFIQVVGHTQQKKIDIKGQTTGGRYYYIDTLGMSREYLIIENDEVSVGQLTNEI